MNKNFLAGIIVSMSVGLAPARAALEFTNVTQQTSANTNFALNAVAFDGGGTFMAVGDNSRVLTAQFVLGSTNLLWTTNTTPGASLSLRSVAASGLNRFAAGGANNVVYSSLNATTWETVPTHPFGLVTTVQGLAFNSSLDRFAAVASIPNISYADSSLPSWSPALVKNSVLIESFRGVTALSGNGFAACGRGGDIRLSKDGALTWDANRTYNVSEPELLGIATDGGLGLISVGNAGRVLMSSNFGTNWDSVALWPGPNNTNNAVAYTGDRASLGDGDYIIVGSGGQIWTGNTTNTSNWTSTINSSNSSLRGVAFATTGIMKGVAMVVGDNGAILLGGTPPPAPTNATDQTVCSGSGNTNLSVNLNTNGYPVGTLVVDWFNANGVLVATIPADSLNYYAATNTIPDGGNHASNFVYQARARDLRTGFTSATLAATLTINPRPTSLLTSLSRTNCNDGSLFTLTNVLTGIGPWTVTWSSNGVPVVQPVNNSGPGPFLNTYTVYPTNVLAGAAVTNIYFVLSVSNNATTCSGNRPGDIAGLNRVTVYPTPTVNAVANQGPYCNTNAGLAINFSGPVAGTTFSWTSTVNVGFGVGGVGNIGAFTASNPGTAPVTATVTVTPSANGCVGTPRTFTVTVNPTPTVNLMANQGPYCNTNAGLAINFSGPVAGTTFSWTSTVNVGFGVGGAGNIGAFTASNGGSAPVTATVTVTPSANGCVGTPFTFTVTVDPTPTVNAVANQGPYCNTNAGLAINFSGPVAGTTFSWTSTVNVGFGTGGPGNIGAFTASNAGTAPVTATVTVTPSANGCIGTSLTFTVTVDPTPTVNVVANQGPYCNTNAGLAINFSGPVAGTTFSWTSTVNVGFGVGGAGNIGAFTASNGGTAPVTATVTVTPSANGCVGTPRTFTVTVDPTPTVNVVADQGPYCNTNAGLAINFSGPVAGTTFSWTSTVNVGFGVGGAGNIGAFTATNGGNSQLASTVTVTPSANGCVGTPLTFTVRVNPTPTVTNVVNQTQTVCNGGLTAPVTFLGNPASSFTWVKNNTNILLGPVSGTGTILPFAVTNSGTTPVTATITVTPIYSLGGVNCDGAATNVQITVNPTAKVTSVINQTQTVVLGLMTADVQLDGTATSYTFVNNTTNIGLPASGTLAAAGGMATFGTYLTTNAGTATITFTPHYLNGGVDCTGSTTNVTITVTATNAQIFTIQQLNLTNVVLEWTSPSNTMLLSATNLNPAGWVTNATGLPGTNRYTNSILVPPPYRFFRLTNAP